MSKHHANDADKAIVNSKNRKTKRGRVANDLIGIQIRKVREELNLSQTEVGRMIGVSYQQVQKTESGKNGISAYRLLLVSIGTKKPMEYFVETARAYYKTKR